MEAGERQKPSWRRRRYLKFRNSLQHGLGLTIHVCSPVIDLPETYEYAVWCTFVEVYNENVHDLLSLDTKQKNLTLKQDHKHSDNKFVAGATMVRLWSEQVSFPLYFPM